MVVEIAQFNALLFLIKLYRIAWHPTVCSCSILSLCSLTRSLASSLLLMLNCWTSRCTADPLHSSHTPRFTSLLLLLCPLPLHDALHSSPTLSAPFPFHLLVYAFVSPPFPLFFPTFPLLLPSHITSLLLCPPHPLAPHLCRCWQPI